MGESKFLCKVSANTLKGLLKVAGFHDTRYYLCGILFDTAHNALVATNGNALLLARVELDPLDAPFIVPRETIQAVLKLVKKSVPDVSVTLISEGTQLRQVRLDACKGFVIGVEIDGKYPDYRRIVPTQTSGEFAEFDSEIMSDVKTGLSLINGYEDSQFVAVSHNGRDPSVVSQSKTEGFGIIMSVKMPKAAEEYGPAVLKSFGFVAKAVVTKKAAA